MKTIIIHFKRKSALAIPILATALFFVGCKSESEKHATTSSKSSQRQGDQERQCPTSPLTESAIPGLPTELGKLSTWIPDDGSEAPKQTPLLNLEEIQELNRRISLHPDGSHSVFENRETSDFSERISQRIDWLQKELANNSLQEGQAGSFNAAMQLAQNFLKTVKSSERPSSLHMMIEGSQIFCAPLTTGLFRPGPGSEGSEQSFDRNFDRNHCSYVRPGELIRRYHPLARNEHPWELIQTRYSWGFIHRAQFTPALSTDEVKQLRAQVPKVATQDFRLNEVEFRQGTPLYIDDGNLMLPTKVGLQKTKVQDSLTQTPPQDSPKISSHLPFTRHALFSYALAGLDEPYGWGGNKGHRDCSRFLLDLFALFGIELPRHSGVQAQFGQVVDLSSLDEKEKRKHIRDAAKHGVVLLYMPGHIMLYLGSIGDSDFAISAISEYLSPCTNGDGDTVDVIHHINRVAISSLELGRGSSRQAFIQRISSLSLFGSKYLNH